MKLLPFVQGKNYASRPWRLSCPLTNFPHQKILGLSQNGGNYWGRNCSCGNFVGELSGGLFRAHFPGRTWGPCAGTWESGEYMGGKTKLVVDFRRFSRLEWRLSDTFEVGNGNPPSPLGLNSCPQGGAETGRNTDPFDRKRPQGCVPFATSDWL